MKQIILQRYFLTEMQRFLFKDFHWGDLKLHAHSLTGSGRGRGGISVSACRLLTPICIHREVRHGLGRSYFSAVMSDILCSSCCRFVNTLGTTDCTVTSPPSPPYRWMSEIIYARNYCNIWVQNHNLHRSSLRHWKIQSVFLGGAVGCVWTLE